MENFLVSARKYRPSTFGTVVGQNHITSTLRNAIKQNQIPQAFLFCGPRGVGKTTCARILAKTVNCENINEQQEACNKCTSCLSYNKGNSFNIHELDAASNNSVEDIRSLVDQVRFHPQNGKYKIYIIDEVHMLSQSAFNAFLKTLEEPPSYAIFILATTEKHKIIPTIISRCQIFDFNRIQCNEIVLHLMEIAKTEGIKVEEDALHIIAEKADGALRDALSIYDQLVSFTSGEISYKSVIENLHVLDYQYYFDATDELYAENISGALLLFEKVLSNGFDGNNFITGLGQHFRNLLVVKDKSTLKLLETSENIKQKYSQQSLLIDTSFLMSALNIANLCDVNYKSSKNKRLHVELALMKICYLKSAINFAQNVPVNEIAKKKVSNDAISDSSFDLQKKIQHIASSTKTDVQTIQQPFNHSSGNKANSNQLIEPKHANTGANNKELNYYSDNVVKISSLSDIESAITKQEAISTTLKEDKNITTPQIAIEENKLTVSWQKFANGLKEKGKVNLYNLMVKRSPVIKNNNDIELTVDNKVQVEQLQSIKTDLLDFLRCEISNHSLQINTLLSTKETIPQTPFTVQDKFKRMSEKNPTLNELKNRFNLEIEL